MKCRWGTLLALAVMPLRAQTAGVEFFEAKIRPVLANNCYGCHSSKLQTPMGGLVLDTRAGTLKVVSPGKPADSLLLRVIRYKDLRLKMPPSGPLAETVVADFEQWIASGAIDPRADSAPAAAPSTTRAIDFERGRQWWAFQPVRLLPKAGIDSLVLARLQGSKLKPSPEADPATLVRRVYLDVTGLKPTFEEVEAYANDKSPDRYRKLVDRLLASPRYGERWARYWLDIVRYAEDNFSGGQYLYAWRYRDWVVDSLNQDLPYDRFVKLQLAADEMPDAKRDDMRALGFVGLGPVEHKELKLSKDMIQTLMLDEWDERIDTVSRGVLGLTVACARCHDHKFDPISTRDYYGMAGVFASTWNAMRPMAEMDPAVEKRLLWARQRFADLNFGIRTLKGNKDAHPELGVEKIKEYEAELVTVTAELASIRAAYPHLKDMVDQALGAAKAPDGKALPEDPKGPYMNAVYNAALYLDGSHPDITLYDLKPGEGRDLPIFYRGSGGSPREIVPRKFLTVLSKTDQPFRRGSGRVDLAEKMFGDAAPLAARVIVNRVWGWHFGKHLAGTPSDFGDRGEKPSHPELLDHLAAGFVANGWSLKWLHREILQSATYRQSSQPRKDALEIDPENQLLWRMNPRRLDIEAWRDSMLAAAGLLNLEAGGPAVELDATSNTRRTVYGKISRSRTNDLLRQYDFPVPMQHSPTRALTITPLQQLFVMNSPFMEQVSEALAKSVESESPADRVRSLYRKVHSRNPTGAEIDAALTYLNQAPVARFAQILLASNEEIFRQ